METIHQCDLSEAMKEANNQLFKLGEMLTKDLKSKFPYDGIDFVYPLNKNVIGVNINLNKVNIIKETQTSING
jgi:hypothetical protein